MHQLGQRLTSFMHMQGVPGQPGVPAGSWSIDVDPGEYVVTVAVGDGSDAFGLNSVHAIKVQGQTAIAGFVPTADNNWDATTVTATVGADRRLTVSADGSNTKLDYVVVQSSPSRPYVSNVTPNTSQINVLRNAAVSTEVHLLNYGPGRSCRCR